MVEIRNVHTTQHNVSCLHSHLTLKLVLGLIVTLKLLNALDGFTVGKLTKSTK